MKVRTVHRREASDVSELSLPAQLLREQIFLPENTNISTPTWPPCARPVHAVCTQECRLPLEGQPPPEDRGAVIGAPGRRSELLFFVLSG